MEHIAHALARCAELLTLLDPEVIYPQPIPDDWLHTQPMVYPQSVDVEVGDARG